MKPYSAAFEVGTTVQIADPATLEQFLSTWKYHSPLQKEQLAYADRTANVSKVSYYHGGDALYVLEDVPGIWHEQCLVKIT
jgi:hypothetical protein